MRSRAGLLLVAILLVVVTTAASVFWFISRDLTAQATADTVDHLVAQAESSAMYEINATLADVDRVSAAVTFLAAESMDPTVSDWAMYQALEFVPELSGAYIATPDGGFHFVFRDGEGFGTKIIAPDAATPETRVTFTGRGGDFAVASAWSDANDEYDPRSRGWYEAAISNPGEPIWTDAYTFFTSGRPGITNAISSPDGSWVVGIDVELNSLVTLLGELSMASPGESFLYDGASTVLSRQGLVDLADTSGAATSHRMQTAIAAIQPIEVAEASGTLERQTSYPHDHGVHTVSVLPFEVGSHEWFLITDISAEDVPVPITGLVRQLEALALALAGAAVLAILALTIPATKPIARLEREASVDSLTMLPNRRTILQRGEAKSLLDAPMSVAMVDVDKFKRVNDTHGHAVGDEVLRGLAERILSRGCDIGRLGGEEFVILLHGKSIIADSAFIDAMRADIAAMAFETTAGPIKITISVGIASHRHGESFSTTLASADGALLSAKLNGRNRMVIVSEPKNSPSPKTGSQRVESTTADPTDLRPSNASLQASPESLLEQNL